MKTKTLHLLTPLAFLAATACGGADDKEGDGTDAPVSKVAVCGDGYLDPDEACDGGSEDEDGNCSDDCSVNLSCPEGELLSNDLVVQDESDLRRASGCTSIRGDLEIEASSVTSLQLLSALQTVGGDVTVRDNETLEDLSGLASLYSVDGDLNIGGNALVTDLAGLENLQTVGADLSLWGEGLTSVAALSSLTSVGGLSLSAGFADLSGLEGITEVSGRVRLAGNATFTSVTGLNNLATIGGDLVLEGGLRDISALSNLTAIGGNFAMSETGIASLSALRNVATVADVDLDDNYGLVELGGAFDQVTEIAGDIVAIDNYNLLHLDGFNALETLGGALWMADFSVTDVTGFSSLRETCAAGPHSIFDCLRIGSGSTVDLSGLDNLETIGGWASIDGATLVGIFPSLISVAESLDVGGHSTEQLEGFASLQTVGGALSFGTIYIDKIAGFGALTTVGELRLDSLFEMAELDAFQSLQTVTGDVRFDRCHAMTTLGTFGSLTTIEGSLTINDNDLLTDLSAWTAVTSVGGDLVITNNLGLATCEAEALRDAIGVENVATTIQIQLNDGAGTCL